MKITVKISGQKLPFRLINSLLFSDLDITLISVQQILRIGGQVSFQKTHASIIHTQHTVMAPLRHGLFLLDTWEPPVIAGLASYTIDDPNLTIWHQRLAHLAEQNIKRLQSMSTGMKPASVGTVCWDCLLGLSEGEDERMPSYETFPAWDLLPGIHSHGYLRAVPSRGS